MHRLGIIIISLMLILSCSKEGFEVDSVSFYRNIEGEILNSGKCTEYNESAELSARLSNEEDDYSFRIVSPGDILIWEGSIPNTLAITTGASFPSGEYKTTIYSSSGMLENITLELPVVEALPYFDRDKTLNSRYSIDLVEYGVDEEVIHEEKGVKRGFKLSEDTRSVLMQGQDPYGNRISLRQNISI